MTRAAAIELLRSIKVKYIHGGDEAFDNARREALDIAIEALKHDPEQIRSDLEKATEALEHTRWIPVEEGYPGEMKDIIVCDEEGYIDIAYCYPGLDHNGENTTKWFSHIFNKDMAYLPIAWMPLPAPYKKEGKE